ncbi:MAG: DUF4097 domain-containing protein [Calothrix sp. SM1_5_4]|nr:DUF4097 domain-containing protein [Calothrix sp. SM1_5_4]
MYAVVMQDLSSVSEGQILRSLKSHCQGAEYGFTCHRLAKARASADDHNMSMASLFSLFYLFSLVFTYWFVSAAERANYPAQRISASGVERIEIRGVRGKLRLRGKPGKAFYLGVAHSRGPKSDDWNLQVEKKGAVLVLEVFNTVLGPEWRQLVKEEQWPEFDLDLQGPSVPAVVSWRDGSLVISGWTAGVETSLLRGRVDILSSRGDFKLQAVNGEVLVREFKGTLSAKGERGPVRLSSVSAQVQLNWLSGKIVADHFRGRLQVDSADGEVVARGARGEWKLNLHGGDVLLEDFEGRLQGKGESAAWSVHARGKADLEVVSEKGPVRIQWKGAGPEIFLTSKSGTILAPYPVQDRDGYQVVERKRSGKTSGRVFVRTDSGDIQVK